MIAFELVRNAPKGTQLPIRKTKGSAGYDFVMPRTVTFQPNKMVLVKTNVKALMPKSWFLMLVPRSSLFKKYNLIMPNSVGIIDEDYYGNVDNDGNICIQLLNIGEEAVTVKEGEAVIQGIFQRFGTCDDDYVSDIRVGGLGSTGRK